ARAASFATGCGSTSICGWRPSSTFDPTGRWSTQPASRRCCGRSAANRAGEGSHRAHELGPVRRRAGAVRARRARPHARPPPALMLGHVHPDADVLGTLLALGQALEARGWSVVYGGPHPAPALLGFLPGVDRYRTLERLDGRFDVAVLTDCPNPQRTEGLIDQARAAADVVVNIDHHPDNRRYGHV